MSESIHKQDFRVTGSFRASGIRSDIRAMGDGVAKSLEPLKGGVFDHGL